MDSDSNPISDVPVEIQSLTVDVNSSPSNGEVLPDVPPVVVQPVPVFTSTIIQSSFGRSCPNTPMVVTTIQSN